MILVLSVTILLIGLLTKKSESKTFYLLAVFFIGIALSVGIVAAAPSLLSLASETSEVVYEAKEIASLSNGSEVEGKFFLGTGSIDSSPVYYYIEKADDGMRLKSVYASSVVINESSEEPPSITSYVDRLDNEVLSNLFGTSGVTKIVISVPEGTIDQDFNIDVGNN